MKPWARYTFNGKDWIPDREADIITAYKEYYDRFAAHQARVFDDTLTECINEELTKGIKTMEFNKNDVIEFDYSNGNDNHPLVFVLEADNDYVSGFNLHYHEDKGCVFRKYFRHLMTNVYKIGDTKEKTKLEKFKEAKVGDIFFSRPAGATYQIVRTAVNKLPAYMLLNTDINTSNIWPNAWGIVAPSIPELWNEIKKIDNLEGWDRV